MKLNAIILAAFGVSLMGLLMLLISALAGPAKADFPGVFYNWNDGEYHNAKRRRYLERPYQPQVRSWVQRHRQYDDDDIRDGRQCFAPMTVVGDQAMSDEAARTQAGKHWMANARWAHGERAMDLENARDVNYACSRSSVPITGGVVGQIAPYEHRCEITARPCRARKGPQDK